MLRRFVSREQVEILYSDLCLFWYSFKGLVNKCPKELKIEKIDNFHVEKVANFHVEKLITFI